MRSDRHSPSVAGPGVGPLGGDRPDPAAWVSSALSPPVLAVLVSAVITLYNGGHSRPAPGLGLALFWVFGALVPVGFVALLKRRGVVRRMFIAEPRLRVRPLVVAGVSCLLGTVLLIAIRASAPMWGMLFWYGLFGLAAALVAPRWHMSLHAAGAWGPLAGLTASIGVGGMILLPVAILVSWARVAAGAHTRPQVLAGGLAGAGSAWLVIYSLRHTVAAF